MSIKIYIDQGHNPVNPNAGAEGNGLREQDLVYTIGQRLADRLRANPDFEVRLSRPTRDTQLGSTTATSLSARVNEANRWGADYFISLHTNAASSPSASGTEAYAYARGTRAFAFGEDILDSLTAITGLRNRGMQARPGLYVLRKTQMPRCWWSWASSPTRETPPSCGTIRGYSPRGSIGGSWIIREDDRIRKRPCAEAFRFI